MKKNILFLPRWYPNKTDIQLGTFIREQALLLKGTYNISVIYVQADTNVQSKFEFHEKTTDGIHEIIVYFKEGKGILKKILNAKRYKKAQELAYKKLATYFHLCHVHVPYRSAFLALKLRVSKNIPFVVTEHWSGHLTGEFSKKNSVDQSLYKRFLKKASAISCVSELLRKKFMKNTGFDSVVIPNYINYTQPVSDKKQSDKIQILSVSDMADAVKNISGLIHAFRDALKENPNLQLTLVGGGPDEEKIKQLIQEFQLTSAINFKGRLPHNEVLVLMHQCDFYICNSNTETFGMTVAEALRCGKPVISTKCGGPEEFLNTANSILIDQKNNQQLTQALLKMSQNFGDYNAQKIADEIEHKFGKEKVLLKWVSFYETAMN